MVRKTYPPWSNHNDVPEPLLRLRGTFAVEHPDLVHRPGRSSGPHLLDQYIPSYDTDRLTNDFRVPAI
jgi:hypothetical protein